MPCKRVTLSKGTLLGKLEGFRLLGILREKDNVNLVSFFLVPEVSKFKSGVHMELY
jgi:hypothetical protein